MRFLRAPCRLERADIRDVYTETSGHVSEDPPFFSFDVEALLHTIAVRTSPHAKTIESLESPGSLESLESLDRREELAPSFNGSALRGAAKISWAKSLSSDATSALIIFPVRTSRSCGMILLAEVVGLANTLVLKSYTTEQFCTNLHQTRVIGDRSRLGLSCLNSCYYPVTL